MKKNILLWISVGIAVAVMAAAWRYIGLEHDGLACFMYFAGGAYICAFGQVNIDRLIAKATRTKKHEEPVKTRRSRLAPRFRNNSSDFNLRSLIGGNQE